MTETLTLGSLVLVCEPSSHGFVYVTIPDGGCDDRLMITATQWQSIIALGDKQRAADKEIERLEVALAACKRGAASMVARVQEESKAKTQRLAAAREATSAAVERVMQPCLSGYHPRST